MTRALTNTVELSTNQFSGVQALLLISKNGCFIFSLHISSTCPGQWRGLMESCWRYEADTRPTFVEVLKTLDEIARSKFHQMTNDSDFYSLQDDWKLEIDDMLNNIRAREHVRKKNTSSVSEK